MPGIVFLGPDFGGGPQRIRDPFGGPFIIGGEADPHMAVIEDRVVLTVGFLDLIQALGDQESLDAIAPHEREGAFKEVEPSECGKFIQHHQQAMIMFMRVQILGQPAPDLVQHQTDQRFCATDIRGWYAEIKRGGTTPFDNISNPPGTTRGNFRDDRIAIQA